MGKRKRNRAIFITLIIATPIASLIYLALIDQINSTPTGISQAIKYILDKNFVILIPIAIGAFAVRYLLSYLQTDEKYDQQEVSKKSLNTLMRTIRNQEIQINEISEKFNTVIQKLQTGSSVGEIFSLQEKEKILKAISTKIESESQEKFEQKILNSIGEKLSSRQAEELFSKTLSRLEKELESQSKRGNVNLILGIMTTLTGVAILGYSVFLAPILTTNTEIISHFLPRLSLVILIEVFAYFFLKLYKQGLAEIKYFQNEITNIESKYLGLHIATTKENSDGTLKAIEKLINTERNFILEKDQTTSELELRKIESSENTNTINKLGEILESVVKKG